MHGHRCCVEAVSLTSLFGRPPVLEEEGGQANGRSSPGSTATGAIGISCNKHRHTNAPAADTPGPAGAAHQLGRQLLCQAGTQVPQSGHTPARAGMSHLGSTGKVTTLRNRSLESSADVATFSLAGRYQWSWQGGENGAQHCVCTQDQVAAATTTFTAPLSCTVALKHSTSSAVLHSLTVILVNRLNGAHNSTTPLGPTRRGHENLFVPSEIRLFPHCACYKRAKTPPVLIQQSMSKPESTQV